MAFCALRSCGFLTSVCAGACVCVCLYSPPRLHSPTFLFGCLLASPALSSIFHLTSLPHFPSISISFSAFVLPKVLSTNLLRHRRNVPADRKALCLACLPILPACSSACLPVRLLACLPSFPFLCLPVCFSDPLLAVYLPISFLACLSVP